MNLDFDFGRSQQVIGIQILDEIAVRVLVRPISRCRRASMRLTHDPADWAGELTRERESFIR